MALYVSTEDLRQVANNLNNKKNEIMNIYNSKVKPVMQQSKEAITVSGLNFEEFNRQFNQAFTNLANEIGSLSNALTNKIIPNYNDLSQSIRNAFNNEFANQMSTILANLKK